MLDSLQLTMCLHCLHPRRVVEGVYEQHTLHSPLILQEALWGRSGLEGPGLNQRQKVLYGLGAVFLRYIWARADQAVASQYWGDEPRR